MTIEVDRIAEIEREIISYYDQFQIVRQKIEQTGMTKELLLKQSDLCFNIQDALAAIEEKTKEETHE